MNWNRNMSREEWKKRRAYPSKRTMNLYYREDRTARPATVLLYVLFLLVVLGALGKVLIFDPLQEIDRLEAEAVPLEEQSQAAQAQLADYPEVLERYTRYAPTQEELSLTDRMAVLDLIDQVIRPAAEISQVTIQDQQALVTFSGVTLVETAGLVAQLEQSELVAHTTVSTAASEDGRQNIVDVNLFIDLTTGEEAAP